MKILISPMEWGMGHASRCVPVIRELQSIGHDVIAAANGRSRMLLKKEFPKLKIIDVPPYNIRHSGGPLFPLFIIMGIPGILLTIIKEHLWLKKAIGRYNLEGVISDNRFGLFTGQCPCVIITHQLFIKSPKLLGAEIIIEAILRWATHSFLKLFNQVWVPDYAGKPNLSGDLSHGKSSLPSVHYIGPLCRFVEDVQELDPEQKIDFLALISGPEPQRSRMEKIIVREFRMLPGKRVVMLGRSENEYFKPADMGEHSKAEDLVILPHAKGAKLNRLLLNTRVVITRPGYTTLMELAGLKKKSIYLIPTPGQTEQEYLAKKLSVEKIALSRQQSKVSAAEISQDMSGYKGFTDFNPENFSLKAFLETNEVFK